MKINKSHIGLYIKGEDWFYPVRVVFVDTYQFVYKNSYGELFVAIREGDWQVDFKNKWWRVPKRRKS
jgi:hypothetical protein